MKKKLVWRLKEQPKAKMLQELVETKILTKEEAREILFSSETEIDTDEKSLKSEIKFLRELVEKLSEGKSSRIVEVIKEVEIPVYRRWNWYQPYIRWYDSDYTIPAGTPMAGSGSIVSYCNAATSNFSDIKTF